jgi:TFIIF-interacting CTD phosphatase-like protein
MFGEYAYRKDKIFQYLTIQDKNVALPDLKAEDQGKLTLYIEPDNVLLTTFICNENFGYISNPASKDPEHEFFLKEINQPVLVYMRDHWEEFVEYLRLNEDWIEPIIYTSALHPYTRYLMQIIDP